MNNNIVIDPWWNSYLLEQAVQFLMSISNQVQILLFLLPTEHICLFQAAVGR
jgi:hypothetical protein